MAKHTDATERFAEFVRIWTTEEGAYCKNPTIQTIIDTIAGFRESIDTDGEESCKYSEKQLEEFETEAKRYKPSKSAEDFAWGKY